MIHSNGMSDIRILRHIAHNPALLSKEKDIEISKGMVEKIRLEEDLRIATMEKKRLADSERILLNTFDTLKVL